jgi:hypothetical protein
VSKEAFCSNVGKFLQNNPPCLTDVHKERVQPKPVANDRTRSLLIRGSNMRFVCTALCVMLLTSCYPVLPYKSRAELINKGEAEDVVVLDIDTARDMVVGLRLVLSDASYERQKAALIGGETLFYGTLVAAVGVAVDEIGVRNVGGGVAALSTILTNHYRLTDQQVAFHKAALRAQCVEDAIAPISPTVRILLPARITKDVGGDDITGQYDDVPGITLDAVNKIQGDLEVALAGITLPVASKDDLNKIFDGWFNAKQDADASDPGGDAGTAATNAVSTANAAFGALGSSTPTLASALYTNCTDRRRLSRSQRRQCDLGELAMRPGIEIQDKKRAFLVAIQTYKTTVDACLAQNAQ